MHTIQVNVQSASTKSEMSWNFANEADWLAFLSPEWTDEWLRRSDTVEQLANAAIVSSGKHLEMPNTWVERMFLSNDGNCNYSS